ncbi:hypothetical protein GW17_00026039 [Ensete ventricosum]|nr:hypothetical protein GW17_00026039 [Ensete ventricosum]RZS27228.1 hypothetical protein BHM03_00060660 [Ensete ventricosum]
MRQRLVFLRWDEAAPRSPSGVFHRRDEALPRSSTRRRGDTSSSCVVTRRRLILPLEDEASLGRGVASFFHWKARRLIVERSKTRQCLVFQHWDKVLPRSYAGRRGGTSFSRWKMRCRVAFQQKKVAT